MYLIQIPYYGQKSDLSIGHINFNSWLTDFSFGGGAHFKIFVMSSMTRFITFIVTQWCRMTLLINADVILYPQRTISSYCPYQEVCLIATWHLRWSCLKELLSMCMAFQVDTFQTSDSSLRVSVMARLYLQSGEIPLGENKIKSHLQKKKCHQMVHGQLQ